MLLTFLSVVKAWLFPYLTFPPFPWGIPPWFWPFLPERWYFHRLLCPEVPR